MEQNKIIFNNFLKVLGLGIIFAILVTISNMCSHDSTVSNIIYIPGDTVTYYKTYDSLIPYAVYYPEYIKTIDTVYKKADTVFVFNDYFLTREYKDTIVDDTSIFIAWRAVVHKNILDSLQVEYKNRRMTKMIIQNDIKPSKALYLGVDLGTGVTPKMSYTQDVWLLEVGYNTITKQVIAGVGIKLWQNKK